MAARLITIDLFENDETKDALVDAVIASKGGLFEHIMGQGVMNADPHNETSINPAIRRSLAIFGLMSGIANQDMSREEFIETME